MYILYTLFCYTSTQNTCVTRLVQITSRDVHKYSHTVPYGEYGRVMVPSTEGTNGGHYVVYIKTLK